MKLLVLGAGVVGKHIARTAADMPVFGGITVADRLPGRAANLAAEVGGTGVAVDATDQAALVTLMEQADLVVSAIGPATRFGVSTLRAAIRARRTFVDITDDPHPTLDMLKLDAEARAAGVTAIIGTGASPGVSNLLAVAAGRALDRVDRLLTGWGSGGEESGDDDEPGDGANAALQHWVEQCSGAIPALVDGRIADVPPLRRVVVDYPGLGPVTGRTVGHPEPVTLARRFPELREAFNVMNFSDFVFDGLEAAAAAVNAGASPAEGARILAARFGEDASLADRFGALARLAFQGMRDALAPKLWLPPLWALAEGERDGRPARIGASLNGYVPGGTGRMTGVPCALIAGLLATGAANPGPGVHSVETAVDPDRFFAALAPYLRDSEGRVVTDPVALVRDAGPGHEAVAAE
ncbi:saccharopine dehydrogenase [Rhodobacter sp. HX-7-19]|uniref:Saccharopine dehydrogenase n=1 Tax=Paragemmobacter kunshanensis TaxID=2583234 RepID=A0A6M1TXI3_9RHOB|nr:saccharopine dehydrogenase NADP-binding domain-containing protein [Rhodobacter kunshanensis]NGQ92900.1 saccharopine dehydrogenase [Rhodobacter kunshanensis]